MVLGKQLGGLMDYIQTWVRELQQASSAANARRQFGWADNNKSFILGNKQYTKDGVFDNHPSSATFQFFSAFEPKGTLQGWKDMIAFYNRDGLEMHQYVVATAFGSPLMQFIPNISAAALHIYNKDSGLGKTTAMLAACTVWGAADDLVISKTGTNNFQMNRAEIYKNIPLWVDEITNGDGKALSDWAYELSSTDGRQRGRMSGGSNQERVRGEPWSFISVTTGNISILEKMSEFKEMPKAEAQRILEYHAKRYMFDTVKETVDFNQAILDNSGHAGPIFMQYVLTHMDDVQDLLSKVKESVDRKFKLTHENRFWSAEVACSLTGAFIAINLGLLPFDHKKLFNFAGALITENKRGMSSTDKSTEELLVDFMNENYSNILRINSGGDDVTNAMASMVATANLRNQLAARYETDTHKLFIVPKVLRYWCIKQQLNYSAFVADLHDNMQAEIKPVRMYKGTELNLPASRAIIVPFEHREEK